MLNFLKSKGSAFLYCERCFHGFIDTCPTIPCPECFSVCTIIATPHRVVYKNQYVNHCSKCNIDLDEATWYSQHGYAHEYPDLHNCPISD